MKRYVLLFCLLSLNSHISFAQVRIAQNVNVKSIMPASDDVRLLNALDTLLVRANTGKVLADETNSSGSAFSQYTFNSLEGIENSKKDKNAHYYEPEIINLYPIAGNQYVISLAYMGGSGENVSLRAIVEVIANVNNDPVTFSIPLYSKTKDWKIGKVGLITYHYPDYIDLERARQFNKDNTRIAVKLGLQPEKFDFYLCGNYQDILQLLGYEFDSESSGNITDGYGPAFGNIFSIMHNENFSHDVFHYYAAKIRKHERNSAAEEGIAYSWGNAYYTDKNGEMITQRQLVAAFKEYLIQHPQASLFELFTKGPMIFGDKTKVRSLLSSLICDEVERRAGTSGIKELIDCGQGDGSYFRVVHKFTGINIENFDPRVKELLEKYK